MSRKAIFENCNCDELFHTLEVALKCTDPEEDAHLVRPAPSSTLVHGGRAATANLVCDVGTQSFINISLPKYVAWQATISVPQRPQRGFASAQVVITC